MGLIVPVLLTVFVYLISHSTNNYPKLLYDFEKKWDSYIMADPQKVLDKR